MKIAVMIPTFRRPGLLKNALESLAGQTAADFPVVVTDNDAIQTEGVEVAEAWARSRGIADRVHVTIAAARGLSQNRNNGLALAFDRLGMDAVAMLDDDSEAHPEWLARLVGACREGIGLVGGPTIYRLPPDIPHEVYSSGIFGVPFTASGFVPRFRSSNNCLITRQVFERAEGKPFDPAFGATGGEDTHLFIREKLNGTRFWWQADAIIYEDVPITRCTREWIAHRERTTAVNSARIDRKLSGIGVALLRQPYLAAKDVGEAFGHLFRREDRSLAARKLRSAAGRLQGLVGARSLHDSSKRS